MKTIPLTKGKVALVDDRHYQTLMAMGSWCYQSPGYAATRNNGDLILMHRVVVELECGPDSSRYVDHENRNRLDNRFRNLRYATPSESLMNTGKRSDNTSGYRGVFWHKGANKWMAQIKYQGKHHYLGLFECKHEAATAYNEKAKQLAGQFARLNEVLA